MLATAKIHILKQFTTRCLRLLFPRLLCLLLQRYTFWSNSQQQDRIKFHACNCACYCKDTHFEAIHNQPVVTSYLISIVLATAKIHILKQFTTTQRFTRSRMELCLLLQRYTFWSNSQQNYQPNRRHTHCACYCKDTHFEAIHNRLNTSSVALGIVLATAKIHILKQFTTRQVAFEKPNQLCLLLQRYTFWSNSQHWTNIPFEKNNCACYCKDTHFEAIHNAQADAQALVTIVLATAKIHILKQFTTGWLVLPSLMHCACYCKDTHFEAIHNLTLTILLICWIVLATAKIHILKQFTTL